MAFKMVSDSCTLTAPGNQTRIGTLVEAPLKPTEIAVLAEPAFSVPFRVGLQALTPTTEGAALLHVDFAVTSPSGAAVRTARTLMTPPTGLPVSAAMLKSSDLSAVA